MLRRFAEFFEWTPRDIHLIYANLAIPYCLPPGHHHSACLHVIASALTSGAQRDAAKALTENPSQRHSKSRNSRSEARRSMRQTPGRSCSQRKFGVDVPGLDSWMRNATGTRNGSSFCSDAVSGVSNLDVTEQLMLEMQMMAYIRRAPPPARSRTDIPLSVSSLTTPLWRHLAGVSATTTRL